MKNIIDRRSALAALTSALALSACGSLLGPQEAPGQIYVLAPNLPSSPEGLVPHQPQIAVALPQASTSLSSDRIALVRNQILDYYAASQWTDSVPQLLQNLLTEALENGGAMGAVAKDDDGVRAEFVIQSAVNAFEARYEHGDAPPTVVIDLTVKVVASTHGQIAAAHDFRAEALAGANSVSAVVSAFDVALSQVLPEIAQWTLGQTRETRRSIPRATDKSPTN